MPLVTGYVYKDATTGNAPTVSGKPTPSGFLPDLNAVEAYLERIGVDIDLPDSTVQQETVKAWKISATERFLTAAKTAFKADGRVSISLTGVAITAAIMIFASIIMYLLHGIHYFNSVIALAALGVQVALLIGAFTYATVKNFKASPKYYILDTKK